ncbi:MAG: hypothetical protein SVM80_01790 [Halobacteriota archaeon]|nr:hypothetical protein [Halobacteriota archaeon]
MLEYNFEELFASPSEIHNDFQNIWSSIIKKVSDVKITVEEAQEAVKELVLYDILDGSRTTLTSRPFIEERDDVPLFSIALNHTLQALGARSSVIMVHTSYNRRRGGEDFNRILSLIESGMDLIKHHSLKYDIGWRYLCTNKDYELLDILEDVEKATQYGAFNTYFLFDYNEEWSATEDGWDTLKRLPDINVHVRHTKFQPSGGWIPGKMNRSTFLYSQNGSSYSNWRSDELVAMVAMAVLAKKFNEGEGLSKVYNSKDEVIDRYEKREVDLFQKTVYLREEPQKLFVFGSPIGVYQFYY